MLRKALKCLGDCVTVSGLTYERRDLFFFLHKRQREEKKNKIRAENKHSFPWSDAYRERQERKHKSAFICQHKMRTHTTKSSHSVRRNQTSPAFRVALLISYICLYWNTCVFLSGCLWLCLNEPVWVLNPRSESTVSEQSGTHAHIVGVCVLVT